MEKYMKYFIIAIVSMIIILLAYVLTATFEDCNNLSTFRCRFNSECQTLWIQGINTPGAAEKCVDKAWEQQEAKAVESLESRVGVRYDSKIIERLEDKESVYVSILLKEIEAVYPNEFIDKDNRDTIRLQLQEEIINSLGDDEFNLTSRNTISGRSFSGWITHKGLDKLKTDERILSITLPEVLQIHE